MRSGWVCRWLARGALLLGDMEKAERYAKQVREACAQKLVISR